MPLALSFGLNQDCIKTIGPVGNLSLSTAHKESHYDRLLELPETHLGYLKLIQLCGTNQHLASVSLLFGSSI